MKLDFSGDRTGDGTGPGGPGLCGPRAEVFLNLADKTGGDTMIVIYAECLVNPQKTDEFVKLAGQLVQESKKEQGNVSYELIHCREGRNIYAFLEKWQDQDILDTHMRSKHFTTIFPQIEKMLICPAKLNSYTVEA